MENASKALLMGAGVLIGVLVLSLAVYLYNIFSTHGANQTKELYEHQLSEFNNQFTKYETMDVITIYDIISLANYAKNYNDSLPTQEDKNSLGISVKIENTDICNFTTQQKNNLIEKDINLKSSSDIPTYKEVGIEYSNVTGKVKSITFKKK